MVERRAGVAPCNLQKRDLAPCLAAPLGDDSPVSESSTSREKGATRNLPVAPVFGPRFRPASSRNRTAARGGQCVLPNGVESATIRVERPEDAMASRGGP